MRWPLVVVFVVVAMLAAPIPAQAAPPPWYPPLRWSPAAAANYDVGRAGSAISYIVIHGTDGRYDGALSWFRDPRSRLSAHYVVRASDGLITQSVAEADTAFHTRGFNRQSIGIEHEYDPASGITYTDAEYRSSATLVCAIARRYSIPLDRAHIIGHDEAPNSDHRDPGPAWDWTRYMSLVWSCGGGGAPRAGLGEGSDGGDVAQLQRALVTLGWMSAGDLAGGEGHFGPRTRAALEAFQAAMGVPSTGYYGTLSTAALARVLATRSSSLPSADLEIGTISSDVAMLQTALRQRGYMDAVTGFFGPVTRDALRRYQADHGVAPTGYYGPLTRAAFSRELR